MRATRQDKWSLRFRAKSFCSTTKFFPLSSDKTLTSHIFLHNFEHIKSPDLKSLICFLAEAILYFTSPILWNLYMVLIWILPCWNIFIRFGRKSLARYWARPGWVYLVFMAMLMLIGCPATHFLRYNSRNQIGKLYTRFNSSCACIWFYKFLKTLKFIFSFSLTLYVCMVRNLCWV